MTMRWLMFVFVVILAQQISSTLVEDIRVRGLIHDWAPLVWLAPGERFLPLGVPEFLDNMQAADNYLQTRTSLQSLLQNRSSFLHGRKPADNIPIYALLKNCIMNSESLIPSAGATMTKTTISSSNNLKKHQLPIPNAMVDDFDIKSIESNNVPGKYCLEKNEKFGSAVGSGVSIEKLLVSSFKDRRLSRSQGSHVIPGNSEISKSHILHEKILQKIKFHTQHPLHFHVTYWMFYPFSEGKAVCVLDLGILGSWPIPSLGGTCFGRLKEYGNHVGDWEHVSLYFKDKNYPLAMYVSAHDAGAFYRYEPRSGTFIFESQETRKGIFQKPIFPERVFTADGSHPILFSARGSHGLWTAPGKHKFVRLPRLYDESGFGTPWPTWRKVELLSIHDKHVMPEWMNFTGKWGNPKSNCHPLTKLGFDICEFVDGPTGIPMKKMNFRC